MTAAATAAGYLYASGRLRERTPRAQGEPPRPEKRQEEPARRRIRVAIYPAEEKKPRQRRVPKIEYRIRKRWTSAA